MLYDFVCHVVLPSNMSYKNLDMHTLEQPGVKAPGTAKRITFLPAHKSATLTLLAGESSNKSIFGTLSPTYSKITKI